MAKNLKSLGNISVIKKKDGSNYSVRQNRMAFFMPDDWNIFYDGLTKKQQITFNFLIQTGARINEVRNVTVDDVNMQNRFITLRVTKVRAKLKESRPKPRIVSVSKQFISWVREVVRENGLKGADTFGILSTPAANIAMKKRLKDMGKKDWNMFSIHNIRKTHETWLLALDIQIGKIAKRLGHKTATALESYIQEDVFTSKDKEKIKRILGEIYEQNREGLAI
jgi:integrase